VDRRGGLEQRERAAGRREAGRAAGGEWGGDEAGDGWRVGVERFGLVARSP